MRVVHSSPTWLEQTQTWLYTQASALPSDIETHVVCESTKNLDQFPMPRIWSLAERDPAGAKRMALKRKLKLGNHKAFLLRFLRDHRVDLVHSHFGNIGWEDMGAVRAAGCRHVVTFYGYDLGFLPKNNPVWFKRYQTMFQAVDLVLCEGSHMGQGVVALGCPESKVRVHHLGIHTGRIPFAPLAWSPGEPLRVLIAATFREKKGVPYAVEALGRLAEKVDLRVTVIGDATAQPRDQQEKAAIMERVERFRLADRIQFLGFQPYARLLDEATRHHVFLSPSVTAADGDTEGGAPVSIIEMSASGMMIVSTTHADIPEVIRDGETGLLAAERDADGLVERLQWMVDHPERWDDMRLAGRRHIEAEYDSARQGERLGAIYREVVKAGRS